MGRNARGDRGYSRFGDAKLAHAAMLARVTGLEPATSGVTGRRSNQLSYTRIGRVPRVKCASVPVKRRA